MIVLIMIVPVDYCAGQSWGKYIDSVLGTSTSRPTLKIFKYKYKVFRNVLGWYSSTFANVLGYNYKYQ